MNPKKKLSDTIAEIFDKLVSKTNNIPIVTDNMSCIIVQFVNSNDKYINNINTLFLEYSKLYRKNKDIFKEEKEKWHYN